MARHQYQYQYYRNNALEVCNWPQHVMHACSSGRYGLTGALFLRVQASGHKAWTMIGIVQNIWCFKSLTIHEREKSCNRQRDNRGYISIFHSICYLFFVCLFSSFIF
jgi:hypothetical protein